MSYNGKKSKATTARKYNSLDAGIRDKPLSYGDVNTDVLYRCVEAVTDVGDAILFGRTADGGALSLRVLSGGETYASYFPDIESLEKALVGVMEDARG